MKFLDLNSIKNFLMGRQASTPGVAGHHVDSAIDMSKESLMFAIVRRLLLILL